jgi:hypothetical protein
MRRGGRVEGFLIAVGLALVLTATVVSAQPVTDRERFEADQAYRKAQLEQTNRDLELKREQQMQDWWFSPLVLAILGAIATALTQIFVVSKNAKNQLDMENSRAAATRIVEKQKADDQIALEGRKAAAQRELDSQQFESDRILEAVKTGGNTEAAAENLKFLLDAGLITTPALANRMSKWLATRKPGEGPSLPSADGRFHFERKSRLPEEAQSALAATLDRFLTYLDELGFERSEKSVSIQLMDDDDAYYVNGKVMLGPSYIYDQPRACRLYMHHVLKVNQGPEVQGIEIGLADYFPSSFLNDSHRKTSRSSDEKRFYCYAGLKKAGELDFDDMYRDGLIWSDLFWRIRTATGAPVADRLMHRAWARVKWPKSELRKRDAFLTSLLDASIAADARAKVEGVLRRWGYAAKREPKPSPQRDLVSDES